MQKGPESSGPRCNVAEWTDYTLQFYLFDFPYIFEFQMSEVNYPLSPSKNLHQSSQV